jgi:hypothetical protein
MYWQLSKRWNGSSFSCTESNGVTLLSVVPVLAFSSPFHLCIILYLAFILPAISRSLPAQQTNESNGEISFSPEDMAFFENKVRPLLVEHCYECHSVKSPKLKANLRVDSRKALLKGGDSGAAIDLAHPDESLLMQAITYEGYEMPPKGKLSDEAIQTFRRWLELGAPWPTEAEPTVEGSAPKFDLQKRVAEHWMWKPVQNPPIPAVQNRDWPKSDADHFILRDLEQAGLTPAKKADRLAILRRLYFDIIGLPPTAEQVAQFIEDSSPQAFEKVVDQLLNSPHFGERWGRHWLDLVRYAESRGHEFDNDSPNAYQYRDYIIRALNADIPYDQLVREHIAGDLIQQPRLHPDKKFNESVLGTGFWFLGEWVHSPVDVRKDEADRFDNMLDVMSKTFLGVTVACARCHDHKFDAISSDDYYALSGFLQSSDYRQAPFESMEQNRLVAEKLQRLDQEFGKELKRILADADLTAPTPQPQAIRNDKIVVDYSHPATGEFMQDGVIFGFAPRSRGELYLDDTGGVRIRPATVAVNDSFWHGLKAVTEGAVQNSSQLDQLPKPGRTLRSPTFEVTDGNVFCRVEGKGHIVACVDSHRLIAGPLHGDTIRGVGETDRWIHLNLKRYIGHRLHLEFVPADSATLAVHLVAQGISDEERRQIDSELDLQALAYQTFAQSLDSIVNTTIERKRITFTDFESGSYGEWIVEGEAFGPAPQTAETIADYQGDVNHRGKFFVNSHNIRKVGSNTAAGDQLIGTLTSPEFMIDCDEIEFLIGGGAHAGKTCVNLLVDGKVAHSATGRNNNRMNEHSWDVKALKGQRAKIEVVDAFEGGWGNIGVDDIAFIHLTSKPASNSDAQQLAARWKEQRSQLKSEAVFTSHTAPAMMDGSGENDYLLIRGNPAKPGKLEPRRFLSAISGEEPMTIPVGSGRLQLAEWINSPTNPLTHRVIVNRIWHYLMGRGIVPTVDDFGVLGQRPSNPALLDHLTTRFLAEGRSIKKMIRYIVLSKTYQMSSQSDPTALAKDPNNLLWHHRPPKRLEGEAIRDALLTISGTLSNKQFGPPVPIHLTPFMDGRGRPGVSGPLDGEGRRSIYISVRRNFISPWMLAFDTPVPFSTMGRRNVSNVPAQALILMNDPMVLQQAAQWRNRILAFSSNSQERIRYMYLAAFARPPRDEELAIASNVLVDANDPQQWADLAHILINTKEFIFLR